MRYFHITSVIWISLISNVFSADLYFTNNLGGNFTNKTLWTTTRSPTNSDNANFTNNVARQINWTTSATNANAFFNTTVGVTYTQAIGSSKWYVTNQYVVGQNTANTAIVTHTSGTLIVTNAGSTSSLIVGRTGDGTYNLNGGTIIVDHLYATNINHSDFNFNSGTLTILDDSIISNTSSSFVVGNTAGQSANLFVNGGNVVVMNDTTFLGNVAASTTTVAVAGSGTILNLNTLKMGQVSDANLLVVSNSATLITASADVGALTDNNTAIITGAGTLWTNTANLGIDSQNNTLIVSNGASVFVGGAFGLVSNNNTTFIYDNSTLTAKGSGSLLIYDGSTNTIVVSGSNALLDHRSGASYIGYNFTAGQKTVNNRLIITNGGMVLDTTGVIGDSGLATNNSVLVSGAGSVWSNSVDLYIGSRIGGGASSGGRDHNSLMISNGGSVYNDNAYIGDNFAGTNESVIVTGIGSLWLSSKTLSVGTNANTAGSGLILVLDQGTLEANVISNGFNGSGNITNNGGIFQFTTSAPNITTNAGGAIVITNGTISYRNIANAPIIHSNDLTQVQFFGNNTFMLNNATNAILKSYTFTNGLGATNYTHLTLINGNSRWQATNTTIGVGSQFLITNANASTFGTITNSGTIQIAGGSDVTNEGIVIINGTGAGNAGSINNISGTNTFNGPLKLGSNARIGTDLDQLTLTGTLTNNGFNLNITNAPNTTLVISSVISGTGGITHTGNGSVTLGGMNTFSGPVTNVAGTIEVNSATGLGTTTSLILNGGTLLFTGSLTNTSANVVLNGGIIQEVDTNVSLGSLTITADSKIQLSSGGGAGRFRFTNATNTVGSGATLTIYGWTAGSGSGGSDDLIFFTSSTFESSSFLNNVTFFGTGGGARLLSTGELVPITPEPNTLLAGATLLTLLFSRLTSTSRKLFKSRP